MVTKIIQEADLSLIAPQIGEMVVTTEGKLLINDGAGYKTLVAGVSLAVTSGVLPGNGSFIQVGNIMNQASSIVVPENTTTMTINYPISFKPSTTPILTLGPIDGEPFEFYITRIGSTGFDIQVVQLIGSAIIHYSVQGQVA